MRKQTLAALAVAVSVGLCGTSAFAISMGSVGGAVKGAAKEAGKGAVEAKINKKLEGMSCPCQGSAVKNDCMKKVAAELKTQHVAAEKSGFGDLNVYVKSPQACHSSVQQMVRAIFGSWDSSVSSKKDGAIEFSVKLY